MLMRLMGCVALLLCVSIVGAQGIVEVADCVDQPYGYVTSCGYVTLPQNYDHPDTSEVEIYYSQIKSLSNNPKPDPIVYLVGGPGSSGTQLLLSSFQSYLRPFAKDRDIIVIDQRGTGYSNPSLYCQEAIYRLSDILQSTFSTHAEVVLDVLADCHDRLSKQDIQFGTFQSATIAHDIVNVLLSLGYDQWNILGVSYGSRLALTMMRDYPQYLRSVILDSVYPLQVDLYVDSYYNGERALKVLFDACALDADCNERYPDLATVFHRVYDSLNESPIPVTFTTPRYGQLNIELSGYHFYDWTFSWLYSVDSIELIPRLIYELDAGRVSYVIQVGTAYEASLLSLSLGMHYAVQCQEEFISATERDYSELLETFPYLAGYVTYPVEGTNTLNRLCATWQTEARPEIANQAVVSDIPTLLLSGNFDPITPPRYANLVSETLSNSYNYVLPHVGHGVLRSEPCAIDIALAFVDSPDSAPDSSCIEETLPMEFN